MKNDVFASPNILSILLLSQFIKMTSSSFYNIDSFSDDLTTPHPLLGLDKSDLTTFHT